MRPPDERRRAAITDWWERLSLLDFMARVRRGWPPEIHDSDPYLSAVARGNVGVSDLLHDESK